MNPNKRNLSLDLIRIFALFCTISVHFFLNTDFYSQTNFTNIMYLHSFLASFFIICVPLFLILTGYLMSSKKFESFRISNIKKTICIYIISSIFCIVYRVIFKYETFKFSQVISSILNYEAAKYSWYIEMYIGLFLFMPFLNTIYQNLKNKKQKQYLIFIMLLTTCLPNLINYIDLTSNDFFSIEKTFMYLPDYWIELFPITYYFIGAYIREFNVKINKLFNILLIIITTFTSCTFNLCLSEKKLYLFSSLNSYNSIFVLLISILVFVFILNININKVGTKISKFIGNISDICLGGYLLSYIFDDYFYYELNKKISIYDDKLKYFFIIVPLILVSSLLLSYITNFIYNILNFLCYKIYNSLHKIQNK